MENQLKNFNHKNPVNEINGDIKIIEECCENLGELYKHFVFKYNPSENELTIGYNNIIGRYKILIEDKKISLDQRENFRNALNWLHIAFKILKDKQLKSIYDEHFLKTMIEFEKSAKKNPQNIDKKEYFKSILIYFLSFPTEIISYQISKPNNQLNTLEIGKLIYKVNGISGFLKGSSVTFVSTPILAILDEVAEFLFGFNAKYPISLYKGNILKIFGHISFVCVTRFPFNFIMDVVCASPLAMSSFQVVKKIILREDQSSNGFQFKNVYHPFISSILIYAAGQSIRNLLKFIETKSIEKSKENPNSSFFKYSSLILSNSIFKVFLQTVTQWPLLMLRYQYANDFVQSYITNSPIPKLINPISMAVKIYNQNGLKKFYTGIFSCGFPFYLCNNYIVENHLKYNPQDIFRF